MSRYLDAEMVAEIKRLLWEGMEQEVVAASFSISQTHVSRIFNGEQWPSIEWPDGSTGKISDIMRKRIFIDKHARKMQKKMENWRSKTSEKVQDPVLEEALRRMAELEAKREI